MLIIHKRYDPFHSLALLCTLISFSTASPIPTSPKQELQFVNYLVDMIGPERTFNVPRTQAHEQNGALVVARMVLGWPFVTDYKGHI